MVALISHGMSHLAQCFSVTGSSKNASGIARVSRYTFIAILLSYVSISQAGPVGGNIVGGAGNIQQSNLTTTIRQNTPSMVINWDSYNLNTNEVVNYLQPGASSIALNRILSNSPSQILGQINANGHIVLVNPNGVLL